jgi:putative transposase
MARLHRIDVPGVPQHVIARGINRQPCFSSGADYETYLSILRASAASSSCAVHAFVLMTNHIHLLVSGSIAGAVSAMMHRVGLRYVAYVNRVYARTGTLFEGRFRSSLVQTERYLLTCMRYIELNPVRACMVERPEVFRWSSFRSNAGLAPVGWLVPQDVYMSLARSVTERADAYRALFRNALEAEDLAAIRLHANKNCALGDPSFQDLVAAMASRRAHVAPVGRPRRIVGNGT